MGATQASVRGAIAASVLAAVWVVAGGQATGQQPAAQEPPPQQPVFRAGTALVRVDVSVTGRDDAPVTDLQAEDFEVEEDGIPQAIETAQFVRLDGERTSDTNEPLEIRSPEHARLEAAREDVRLFGIFLDDYHVDKKPDITVPLRNALVKFVEQFRPNDLAVVMDPLTTLDGLKFTRSRSDLLARMRAFEGRRNELFPVRSAVEEAQLTQRNWPELRGAVTLSALTAMATHLGGLREGRKSILFVSQGPTLGPPGSSNDQILKEALRAANRGNVTIHVLDPRPLGSVGFGGDAVLRRIAGETGGRTIVQTNNPARALRGVIDDASAYYLVGYSPTRQVNDGTFHRIAVKVKRRGVDVAARRGYWAASDKELTAAAEAASTPVDTALVAALASMSESASGRAVDVWSGLSRGDGERTRVSFTWEANARGGADKPARLEVQPVGADGTPIMEPRVIAGAPGELPMVATFDTAPGRLRVRFTSLSARGDTLDRWVQTVPVPSFASPALALSTPRFLRARSMLELRAIEADPAPVPAASNRFRPTERVLLQVSCYGSGDLAPGVTVDLLNGKGDLLRALDVPPLVNGSLRLTVPVGSLAPSTYVLRVQARLGTQSARQLAAFRVQP